MTPSLSPEAWAQVRYAYEHTDTAVEDICAEHGISSGTLRDRMRRWNWTRRRSPIPREGPPAMMPPVDVFSPPPVRTRIDASRRPGTGSANDEEGSGGHFAAETAEHSPPTPPHRFAGGGIEPAATREHDIETPNASPLASPHLRGDERGNEPPPDSDPASIVPRLQSAVARVLPAIEATLHRLAAGPLRPREMEQTARALGALTRTLRELNALLAQHPLGGRDDDPVPENIDEFRFELARRIRAFIASREAQKGEADAPSDAEANKN